MSGVDFVSCRSVHSLGVCLCVGAIAVHFDSNENC